jgi:hypothetical protein
MGLVKEILLSNNLAVEIWDNSRAIATDTTKVELAIKIKVAVKNEYFDNSGHFDMVTRVFGKEIFYEYKKERTFVDTEEKEKILQIALSPISKNPIFHPDLSFLS